MFMHHINNSFLGLLAIAGSAWFIFGATLLTFELISTIGVKRYLNVPHEINFWQGHPQSLMHHIIDDLIVIISFIAIGAVLWPVAYNRLLALIAGSYLSMLGFTLANVAQNLYVSPGSSGKPHPCQHWLMGLGVVLGVGLILVGGLLIAFGLWWPIGLVITGYVLIWFYRLSNDDDDNSQDNSENEP